MDAGNWIAIYAAVTSTALGGFQIVSWRHERRRLRDLEQREYRTHLDLTPSLQLINTSQSGKAVGVGLRLENVSRNDAHIQFGAVTIAHDHGRDPPVVGTFEVTTGPFDQADHPVKLPLVLHPGRVVHLHASLPFGPGYERLPSASHLVADHGLGMAYFSVFTAEREFKLERDLTDKVMWGYW